MNHSLIFGRHCDEAHRSVHLSSIALPSGRCLGRAPEVQRPPPPAVVFEREWALQDYIFSGWDGIQRMLVIAPAAYVALVVVLRLSGKRTLSKLNAFDFIVTIAIGSTLASIITTRSLALAEGVAALGLLVGLQYVVTTTSVYWRGFHKVVTAEPTLLLRQGEPLPEAMRRERVTHDELAAAVRQAGGGSLAEADAVFLETDGTLTSILRRP